MHPLFDSFLKERAHLQQGVGVLIETNLMVYFKFNPTSSMKFILKAISHKDYKRSWGVETITKKRNIQHILDTRSKSDTFYL